MSKEIIKLYTEYSEEEFKTLLKDKFNEEYNEINIKEIEDLDIDFFGDFYYVNNYIFRKHIYGHFICYKNPEECHERSIINIPKAKGDRGKDYFTRYRSSSGGKDEFNPVTKTGGFENIQDTKRRLNI